LVIDIVWNSGRIINQRKWTKFGLLLLNFSWRDKRETLKRINNVGPDGISIEFWKFVGEHVI